MSQYIDLSQRSLWIAVASILFNPLFWNIVARQGCYGLALTIFSLGIIRDHLYQQALSEQPTFPLFEYTEFKLLAAVCFLVGGVLVLSSMYALGITGTYLGDYFGILMDEKVDSFPFNVTDNPMYYGSTLSFLGTALWYESLTGILLTILVFVEYKIALTFEEPFTAAIYAAREQERLGSKGLRKRKAIGAASKEL